MVSKYPVLAPNRNAKNRQILNVMKLKRLLSSKLWKGIFSPFFFIYLYFYYFFSLLFLFCRDLLLAYQTVAGSLYENKQL